MPRIIVPADALDATIESVFLNNCFGASIAALIIYEHAITVGEEVSVMSNGRITLIILLFLNRLALVILAIINILGVLSWENGMSCAVIQIINCVPVATMICISSVVAALRVCVASGRGWRFALPTLMLGLVPAGTDIFLWLGTSFDNVLDASSIITCDSVSFAAAATINKMEIVTRICALGSDIIVIIVTWVRLYHSVRARSNHPTIATLLVREGTIYFIALFILNITALALWFSAVNIDGNDFLVIISYLWPMSSILISRFLLNIHEATNITVLTGNWRPSHIAETRADLSSLAFTSSAPGIVDEPDTLDPTCPDSGCGSNHEQGWDGIVDNELGDSERDIAVEDDIEMREMDAGVHKP